MNYGVFGQNSWLFPDSQTLEGKSEGKVSLLKGKTGGFQILVDGLTVGDDISYRAEGFDGINVSLYRERDVCVNRNTNDLHCGALTTDNWDDISDYRVRRAPYRTYDPLVPVVNMQTASEKEVYYVTFCPTLECASGEKQGSIVISFSGKTLSVPFTVKVGKKALPEVTLNVTNWSHISLMAYSHGVEYGSDEHIEIVKKYLALLKECYNNVFWIPFDTMKVSMVDGKYVFDFSEMKKWALLALECGQKTLEWANFIHRPTWEDPPFIMYNHIEKRDVQCLATGGRKYLTALLTQFNDFLTENGWRDISIVHVSDEPKEVTAADYRALCGIFRKYLPGIKLIDAIEIYFVQDALDIYVPKNHYFQLNRNDFEAIRDDRNELWFYTCNMPGGRWMNIYIDSPLLNTRLLHWGNYRFDLKGYLHWGFNHITSDGDPFEQTSRNAGLPAGDTHIVYPGNGEPLRSLRYMEMKCGIEDYTVLNELAKTDKAAADKLCRRAMYSFDRYITDTEEFDNIISDLIDAYDNI